MLLFATYCFYYFKPFLLLLTMRSYLLPVLPPITVGKQSSHGHSPLEPTHGACSPNHCQTKLMGNQCKAQFLDCLKKKKKTANNQPKILQHEEKPESSIFLFPTCSCPQRHYWPTKCVPYIKNNAENITCFSKVLRKRMGTVPLFQACSEICFLQDAACIHFHLESICITKPHKPFLLHSFWKCFVCLESLDARL